MQLYLDYERIRHHKSMLSDKLRTESFRRSIIESVREGDVVADIGAGTGILSFFASEAGAHKVYAVERTGVINIAERIAEYNGIKNIVFLKRDASKVKLKEKCDVIVSECLGYFALQENMISDVISFRNRNLRKNGVVIPDRIKLYLGIVDSKKAYSEIDFWSSLYGVDFQPLKEIAANSTYHLTVSEKDCISDYKPVKTIDLKKDNVVELDSEVSFVLTKDSKAYGLCGFFEAFLPPDIILSNRPGERTHWKTEFFPFEEPLKVRKGDILTARIRADLYEAFVDWFWDVEFRGKKFEHSTERGIRLKEL